MKVKIKKIKYSFIKEKLFTEKFEKSTEHLAEITHFLQKEKSVNFNILPLKGLLNGFAQNITSESVFKNKIGVTWDVPFPPPREPEFTFIDLFAGIGGFRIAMQALKGKCVFSSEIDIKARRTYENNFGEVPFGDIREFTGHQITDEKLNNLIPDHNVLCAGFPCQPFSLAGISARNFLKQVNGFSDKIKGNLFFDIARIVAVKKPDVVFLENVKNFKGHDGGNTFLTVRKTMEDLGYNFFFGTINAEKWVPQSRQRFYMVCFKRKVKNFTFPESKRNFKKLKSILEKKVSPEYTISDKLWIGHINRTKRNLERGTGFTAHEADLEKPSKTLVARYGKDGKECLIPQKGKNPRKLTPRECARLQGFPESFVLPPSNAAAYHQFGNSVAVPVIKAIAKNIVKKIVKKKK